MIGLGVLALSTLCGLVFSVPVPDEDTTVSPPLADSASHTIETLDAVDTLLLDPDHIVVLPPISLPALIPPPIIMPADPGSVLYPLLSIGPAVSFFPAIPLEQPPTTTTTITVPVPASAPSIITDTVTVYLPAASAPTPSSTTTPAPKPSGAKAAWAAPSQIGDLSDFNITAFPAGQQNLHLATGIPASATTPAKPLINLPLLPDLLPTLTPKSDYKAWNNASDAVLRLLYPAHSANPAAKPVGGAEFYATPLDLADAQVVEMTYSVFFPAGFTWVKGGKLPGLFGGRAGCSGGDAATDCFSTRLMWRHKGAGELYLYAPKDKQTLALCADPQSVCDADYGLSVGRGSFNWRIGGWTTVTQLVRLNTPGKQDGGFALYVDGERKIHREDIYYRGAVSGATKTTTTVSSSSMSSGDDDDDDPLGFGTLLPGLLGGLGQRRRTPVDGDMQGLSIFPMPTFTTPPTSDAPVPELPQSTVGVQSDVAPLQQWAVQLAPVAAQTDFTVPPPTSDAMNTSTTTTTTTVILYPTLLPVYNFAAAPKTAVGFVGIFFSTFFGGHGTDWETPRDQYVWFKDFALVLYQ
ncbi:hypothetical protein R3P38DRAFT_610178 [Favolaschia claudopus]|uniref:Polysaccharide lyase 14 domain-containing protein n=1 Tax=Favolaschia claudopus TaxID=2862362 RepID=A0AAW0CAW3_9AGAR